MKKKVQVHMLSTKDKTDVLLVSLKDLRELRYIPSLHKINLVSEDFKYKEYQHLYFTNDEKIKEGDWYTVPDFTKSVDVRQATEDISREKQRVNGYRKIIATTDTSIWEHDDTVPYPKKRPALPQIPHSFIKQYVKAGGKIDEVDIEYEVWTELLKHRNDDFVHSQWTKKIPLNSFIGQIEERIKVNSNNCVIFHPIEEKLYTLEEVNNLPIHIHEGIYNTKVEIINGVVHVSSNS